MHALSCPINNVNQLALRKLLADPFDILIEDLFVLPDVGIRKSAQTIVDPACRKTVALKYPLAILCGGSMNNSCHPLERRRDRVDIVGFWKEHGTFW